MSLDPKISVITVAYNSAKALQEFWSERDTGPHDWIVVDNASTDGSADLAERLGARVVRLPRNRGFAAANNLGTQVTEADVLVFCNPDVRVTESGLRRLAEEVRLRGGLVAPQLVNRDGSSQENGRGTPFLTRKVKHLLRRPDERYCRIAEPGDVIDVPWVIGAAVGVGRDDFEKLGGWDQGFFVYYEDADLCLRAWERGLPVQVCGDVRWVHGWARETGRGLSLRAWRHEVRSAARFYGKHPYCLAPVGRRWQVLRAVEAGRARELVAS